MLKREIRKKIIEKRRKRYKEKEQINLFKLIQIIKKVKLNKPIIGGYFPINHEIDCLNVLNELEKRGFPISLPVVKKNNQMEFYNWTLKEPLLLNKYGIPEPKTLKITYPDVLLVPMVAFDKLRYRIGYGGGYYDRYLQQNKKKKKLLSIGFAFSFQQIKQFPKNKYDKKLDFILTEKSII